MSYTVLQAAGATAVIAVFIALERAFPFLLFSKKDPPKIIRFIERFIPPLVMAALVVYCLKDINFTSGAAGFVPYLAAAGITVVLHLWRHNSLLSICGGTIVYMILIRVL